MVVASVAVEAFFFLAFSHLHLCLCRWSQRVLRRSLVSRLWKLWLRRLQCCTGSSRRPSCPGCPHDHRAAILVWASRTPAQIAQELGHGWLVLCGKANLIGGRDVHSDGHLEAGHCASVRVEHAGGGGFLAWAWMEALAYASSRK